MKTNNFVILLCLFGLLVLNMDGCQNPLNPTPPSPVPGTGYHMLIIEDRAKREDLPAEQFDALMSVKIDEMIRAVSGKKYLYDQNQDVSTKEDPWVKDAMKVPRDSLPWVIIDHDGYGTSQPVKSLTQLEELTRQYVDKKK